MLDKPHLIVVGGFAGAGKSTLAKKLGNKLLLPLFEIDQLMIWMSTNSSGII